jgi:hypothetical protein
VPTDIAEFCLFHRWDGPQEGKEGHDKETASRAGKTKMWRVDDKYAENMCASEFPSVAVSEINRGINRRMEAMPRFEYKYKYPGLLGSEPEQESICTLS